MSIIGNLHDVVVSEIAVGLRKKSLEPDEDLLSQGIIDSLGLMKLVMYMEQSFGIKIGDEDIVPENFQSINQMASLVEQLRNR